MQRQVLCEGGRNFRDLGGYISDDGRRVRWRKVFRSGTLSYLTKADRAELAALNIRASCDFRDGQERELEPTLWPDEQVQRLTWDHVRGPLGMRERLEGRDLTADFATSTMLAFYRRLPYRFIKQYSGLLRALGSGLTPLVLNCAAGKDRTGLGAALILASLGVSRGQIMADYLLTNSSVDLEKELFAHPHTSVGFGADGEVIAKVAPAARAPLLTASPDYLLAAFAQIETQDGSVDAYLRNQLGLGDESRQQLKDQLLEG